jgi:uncharacterized membrane protein HdeD (DUF308 family)
MNAYSLVRAISRQWWFVLIWGIFVVLLGLCALFWSYLLLLSPIVLLSTFALVNGVFGIVRAFQEHRVLLFWWITLIIGILSILLGLTLMSWPHITSIIALDLVAIWAVVSGTLQIALAMSGINEYSFLFLAIIGAATLLLGIVLFVSSPLVPLLPLLRVFGVYGLFYGGMLIVRSFSLRSQLKDEQQGQPHKPEFLQ